MRWGTAGVCWHKKWHPVGHKAPKGGTGFVLFRAWDLICLADKAINHGYNIKLIPIDFAPDSALMPQVFNDEIPFSGDKAEGGWFGKWGTPGSEGIDVGEQWPLKWKNFNLQFKKFGVMLDWGKTTIQVPNPAHHRSYKDEMAVTFYMEFGSESEVAHNFKGLFLNDKVFSGLSEMIATRLLQDLFLKIVQVLRNKYNNRKGYFKSAAESEDEQEEKAKTDADAACEDSTKQAGETDADYEAGDGGDSRGSSSFLTTIKENMAMLYCKSGKLTQKAITETGFRTLLTSVSGTSAAVAVTRLAITIKASRVKHYKELDCCHNNNGGDCRAPGANPQDCCKGYASLHACWGGGWIPECEDPMEGTIGNEPKTCKSKRVWSWTFESNRYHQAGVPGSDAFKFGAKATYGHEKAISGVFSLRGDRSPLKLKKSDYRAKMLQLGRSWGLTEEDLDKCGIDLGTDFKDPTDEEANAGADAIEAIFREMGREPEPKQEDLVKHSTRVNPRDGSYDLDICAVAEHPTPRAPKWANYRRLQSLVKKTDQKTELQDYFDAPTGGQGSQTGGHSSPKVSDVALGHTQDSHSPSQTGGHSSLATVKTVAVTSGDVDSTAQTKIVLVKSEGGAAGILAEIHHQSQAKGLIPRVGVQVATNLGQPGGEWFHSKGEAPEDFIKKSGRGQEELVMASVLGANKNAFNEVKHWWGMEIDGENGGLTEANFATIRQEPKDGYIKASANDYGRAFVWSGKELRDIKNGPPGKEFSGTGTFKADLFFAGSPQCNWMTGRPTMVNAYSAQFRTMNANCAKPKEYDVLVDGEKCDDGKGVMQKCAVLGNDQNRYKHGLELWKKKVPGSSAPTPSNALTFLWEGTLQAHLATLQAMAEAGVEYAVMAQVGVGINMAKDMKDEAAKAGQAWQETQTLKLLHQVLATKYTKAGQSKPLGDHFKLVILASISSNTGTAVTGESTAQGSQSHSKSPSSAPIKDYIKSSSDVSADLEADLKAIQTDVDQFSIDKM